MLMETVKVNKHVVAKAKMLGLGDGDDVDSAIRKMVIAGAPITHPNGNFRFEDWVFKVKDGEVINVHLIRCDVCEDRKRIIVYDVCEHCEGEGCSKCRKGEVRNMIPCPQCALEAKTVFG